MESCSGICGTEHEMITNPGWVEEEDYFHDPHLGCFTKEKPCILCLSVLFSHDNKLLHMIVLSTL